MTKKDFELIENVIRSLRFGTSDETNQPERSVVACRFAVALSKTNPGFDAGRFLKACGVAP